MPAPAQALSRPKTEAEIIADFTLGLDLDAIPAAVVSLAQEHFLDVVGIALASSTFDFGRAVLKAARSMGGSGEAVAIGSGAMLPPASTALVNGVLAHGLDFDDTHIGAIYHASAQAMASCLAAGNANRSDGRSVLTAFIASLEVGCRLALVGAGVFHDRGLHPTSMCGTFASAVAAARLAGADRQAMVWALGLCGSMAGGILEQDNSWLKRLHPGWAAHCGLSAVALGQGGFSGPATVLEGRRGFYSSHLQRIPEADDLPSRGLGETWQTLGLAIKPYPCCHFIHAFADAALELRDRFDVAEIEKIECKLTAPLHKIVALPRSIRIRPATPYQALFSVPFVVATALARGRVDLTAFYDEPLDAPELMELTERTVCIDDPESDYPAHFPGEVIVHLRDGRTERHRQPASLGTPDLPLSRKVIVNKFMANATRAIPTKAAERIADIVLNLQTAPSLDELMRLCVA
ncbi:MmgE/PrpD family protein [Rhodopila sp.]|uniref:MmgE/PrpD family protein n=1 Tax=Rhodopila sp. TaxID=2480087 RepID=UPI003D10F29D